MGRQVAPHFPTIRHAPQGKVLDPTGICHRQDILLQLLDGVSRRVNWQVALAVPAQIEGNHGVMLLEPLDIACLVPFQAAAAPTVQQQNRRA